MFDRIKSLFGKNANVNPEPTTSMPAPPPPPPPKSRAKAPEKSAKELATERGEPYVAVLSMDVDPENLHQGAFELDWNDKFVANLIRAGYQGKSDSDVVDQWFQNVCRHVVMETWEQEMANNPNRVVKSRDTKVIYDPVETVSFGILAEFVTP
jgi:hypothetical protein